DARWPAGVGHRTERPTTHCQRAGELEHLLPVFVDERLGRERSRVEPQKPGPRTPPPFLVEMTREDLLLEPGRIGLGDFPPCGQIERKKLEVFLEHEHLACSLPAGCISNTGENPIL